jgi:hypothetical protein
MEEISRSVRQGKQAKFWMLTVPVRTVRTVTWQGRTIRTVMWQVDDMAHFHWLMLASSMLTRVQLMANDMRTRGPIHGRHVSPSLVSYM